jgi:hypothetical protein
MRWVRRSRPESAGCCSAGSSGHATPWSQQNVLSGRLHRRRREPPPVAARQPDCLRRRSAPGTGDRRPSRSGHVARPRPARRRRGRPRPRRGLGRGRTCSAARRQARRASRHGPPQPGFPQGCQTQCSLFGIRELGRADVGGVVRDLRSPRPFSGLELGPLEQVSDEGPVAQAATQGPRSPSWPGVAGARRPRSLVAGRSPEPPTAAGPVRRRGPGRRRAAGSRRRQPRPAWQRGRLRQAVRYRTAGGLLRRDHPPSPQPRRRPPGQHRAVPDRAGAPALAPAHPHYVARAHRPRQDQEGDHPLPQAQFGRGSLRSPQRDRGAANHDQLTSIRSVEPKPAGQRADHPAERSPRWGSAGAGRCPATGPTTVIRLRSSNSADEGSPPATR